MERAAEALASAFAAQRQRLLDGEDYGCSGEALTELLLGYSICPIHRREYAACFFTDDPECAQVRRIHPRYDP